MKLSKLLELVDDDNDGYLFIMINGVRCEIDGIIDDSDIELLLTGHES